MRASPYCMAVRKLWVKAVTRIIAYQSFLEPNQLESDPAGLLRFQRGMTAELQLQRANAGTKLFGLLRLWNAANVVAHQTVLLILLSANRGP